VDEFRVELVCKDDLIQAALRALKQAHPYEEPAYEVFRMEAL
ncbi:NGG1p interacting factor NIF3, partial [Marinobacter salarius]|nr:NGG1p interacting factor NIF3 [Marinobacter salarius]